MGIKIVPVPAKDEIEILNIQAEEKITIEIYSIIGEKVYAQPGTLSSSEGVPSGKRETKINISNFSKGVYFVIIDSGKEKAVKKFLKE